MLNKIILLIFSFSFAFIGNIALAVTCPADGSWDNSSGVCIPTNTGLPNNTVTPVLQNVMNWLLIVVGTVAIIAFVISGIQYLLSAGDQNAIETAKRNMKWSIVGVVVALMGMVILIFIYDILEYGSTGYSSSTSSETSGTGGTGGTGGTSGGSTLPIGT
jgi:uncharacterized membrane protein YgcG